MSNIIASLDSAYFSYDGSHNVLKDITLGLQTGRIYAICGPNGAGKSTLVGILTGRFEPTEGEAKLGGSADAAGRRKRSACVSQQLSLFPHLTIAENLVLAAHGVFPWRTRTHTSANEFASAHLSAIGIDLPVDAICGSLSFPARQKLEIARALVGQPLVLFLDEPTAALDKMARDDLYSVLRRINVSGTTIVVVTHDATEVEALAATPIVLADGRIEKSADECFPMFGTKGDTSEHRLTAASSVDSHASSGCTPLDNTRTGAKCGHPSQNGDNQVEVEFSSRLRRKLARLPLISGCVTLLRFDDALERTESVAAITSSGKDYRVRLREPRESPWRLLPNRLLSARICVISTDKQAALLFPTLSVLENAAILVKRWSATSIRDRGAELRLLNKLKDAARISYPSADAAVSTLSGGNQQRVILASLIESKPNILVAEEPLMGLDEASHEQVGELLVRYARTGGRLLIATCFPHHYERLTLGIRVMRSSFSGPACSSGVHDV